jgi:ribokinase
MILVFGSVNADLFLNVARLPARGETVLCPTYVFRPGGKGANQAAAAARASRPGGETRMIGRVGRDPLAGPVLEALRAGGVDIALIEAIDGVTGTAAVMVEESGENQIVVASGANLAVTADQIPDTLLGTETTLVLQMEIPVAEIETAIHRARRAGCRIILNLAPALPIDAAALEACDVLVLNEGEANSLVGAQGEAEAHALALAAKLALDCIITLGGSGAVLATNEMMFRIGALEIEPVDTVGAGDAFVGALAASLDSGAAITYALHQASVAGGLACLQEGAQTGLATLAEIESVTPRLASATLLV